MTELIAKIGGIYLLVTGFGFLISPKFYVRMIEGTPNSDPVLLNLSGACHLIVGLIILVNHWTWSSVGAIAVSLLGLAAVAKGATLIIIPEATLKTADGTEKMLPRMGAGFMIYGAFLGWVGFF